MGIESKSQEKYPPISKKRDCHGYGRVENKKIPKANPKRYKKEPVMGMESRRQGKMPANIIKKADKKENASYCNLTYNMARFQLHIPQLS